MQRIVIAGGAGFVGATLAVYLAAQGYEVVAADNLRRRGSEFNLPRLAAAGVRFEHADARCSEDWRFLREFDPAVILDCAAQPSAIDGYANPSADFTNNTMPLIHLLEHCRTSGCGLVLWSTNKVFSKAAVDAWAGPFTRRESRIEGANPIDEACHLDGGDRSLYGASKVMADLMVQEWSDAFGFPAVVNRFSCLAGPWQWGKAEQGWVAWWVIAHRLGMPLQYIGYEGRQVRDVLSIDDLCTLVNVQIMNMKSGSEVFNVGGGSEFTMSLRECTVICQGITGQRVPVETVEQPRRADFVWYVSDIDKVSTRYSWQPTEASNPGKLIERIDAWVCDHLDKLRMLYPKMQAQEEAAG